MKNIKRHLSLLCVVALALAVMVPTVFAATKSYDISYDFTLGSGDGSPTTYDGKDAKDFWYPGNGSATWSIEVSSKSETYVKSAKLYYIRSLSSDVQVETLSSIGAGTTANASFVAIDGKTYYAVITAATDIGVYGTTTLKQ